MTAIDAAVQSKLLGAEEVTICYRRGKEHMNASEFEQDLAASKGVTIRHWLQPKRVVSQFGKVAGIELEYTQMRDGKLTGAGQTVVIPADQVFKAIGQTFVGETLNGSGPAMRWDGHIEVDAKAATRSPRSGPAATASPTRARMVAAVATGRDAAESIHRTLSGTGG